MGYQFQSINFTGTTAGKRLIVLGGVHGNEACGTEAIQRVIAALQQGQLTISQGSVTFVPVCNPMARALQQRCGDRNLNRKLFPTATPSEFEDHVANWLCPLLAQHDVLLDLHSFHTAGAPFAMLGPKNNQGQLEPFAQDAEEESLARHLGVSLFVDGWLDTYAAGVKRRQSAASKETLEHDLAFGVGTTEYMRSQGGYGLTLECGQHDDATAPQVAYRAILNTLAWLGLIVANAPQPVAERQTLRLFSVVDRLSAGDHLAQDWQSFQRLEADTLIGTRADGSELRTAELVYIVFPNPGAEPGSEWFYLARPVQRV